MIDRDHGSGNLLGFNPRPASWQVESRGVGNPDTWWTAADAARSCCPNPVQRDRGDRFPAGLPVSRCRTAGAVSMSCVTERTCCSVRTAAVRGQGPAVAFRGAYG